MIPIRTFACAAGFALLAGCSLSPSYDRPALDVRADGYASAPSSSRSDGDPGAESQWWSDFGSPELDALVDEALTSAPDLQAAAGRVLEARAQFGGQRWNQLPSAEIGGTVSRSKRNLSGFGIPRSVTSTVWDVAAQASWELDFWGRLSNTRRAAWAALMAGEAEQSAVRQGLVADVVRAWLEVKQLVDMRELGRSTLAITKASERMVADRYTAGVRPSSEVHLSRQNLVTAQASLAQAEQELTAARRRLEVLLGRYPSGTIRVGDISLADLPNLPVVPLGLPSDLLERRPDLIAAEMNLLGADARVGAARADLFPRLTLNGSAGWSTSDESLLFQDATSVWSLVGNLAMPLLNRGARKAQVGVADAQREQTQAAYVKTVLGAFRDVESALDADRRQGERLEALRLSVVHARRSTEVIDERYRQGLDAYFQVLDSQRRLLQAQSDLLHTEGARRAARVNLIQALGGDWDDPAVSDQNDEQDAHASILREGTEDE